MTNLHLPITGCRLQKLLPVLTLLACFSTVAQGANEITGSVRNQSREQPAVGDEVILFQLNSGMREDAHVHTGAQGEFTFHVQYPGRSYLVRVVHQGVAYDQRTSAGNVLSIQVFDAAPHVSGVTGSIEILRAGTNGKLLHVSDLYEIKNESSPPMTQAGERTFEVYLPSKAKLDSVLAAGPDKIGDLISAAPVAGEHGHFTVSFPLRPGATKFAFNYDLPYVGHAVFRTRLAYPMQQLAVMIPPAMRFSSRSQAFQILATGRTDYLVQTIHQLNEGEGPQFEVSGIGALPPVGDQAKSQTQSEYLTAPNPIPATPRRAASPSLASIGSHSMWTQPRSQLGVLEGVTFVFLAACALLIWRARKA